MYEDFIAAIWKNEKLNTVYDRLIDEVNTFHDEERAKINNDYRMAQNILYALHEPTAPRINGLIPSSRTPRTQRSAKARSGNNLKHAGERLKPSLKS